MQRSHDSIAYLVGLWIILTAAAEWLYGVHSVELVRGEFQFISRNGSRVRLPQCELDTVTRITACNGVGVDYSCGVATEGHGPGETFKGVGVALFDEVLVCPLRGSNYVVRADGRNVEGDLWIVAHWWDRLRAKIKSEVN